MTSGIAPASTTAEQPWPFVGSLYQAGSRGTIGVAVTTPEPRGRSRIVLGKLEDAALVLLLTLAFPLAILVAGTPVALFGRLLLELARRL